MDTEKLSIKDRVFPVKSGVFGATLGHYEHNFNLQNPSELSESKREELLEDDEFAVRDWMQLRWSFNIQTERQEFDDSFWKPRVYAEDIILEDLAAPYDLVGTELLVADEYDDERDDHLFCIYVFEHLGIKSNSIKFLERDGNLFKIEWTGKCDVFSDDKYLDDLDFYAKCSLDFVGISVSARSRQEADELVSKRLDLNKLKACQNVPPESQDCLILHDQSGLWYQLKP